MKKYFLVLLFLGACLIASAQRKTAIVETVNQPAATASKVIKRKVAIGRFSNETQYAKGIFYDKENDPMGKQALDILSAKLAASGKFILLERGDLATLLEEAKKSEDGLSTIGADYMIIGSITEFGRKNVGKSGKVNLFLFELLLLSQLLLSLLVQQLLLSILLLLTQIGGLSNKAG